MQYSIVQYSTEQYFNVSVPALVWDRPASHTVPGQEVQTGAEVHREEGLPGHDAGQSLQPC